MSSKIAHKLLVLVHCTSAILVLYFQNQDQVQFPWIEWACKIDLGVWLTAGLLLAWVHAEFLIKQAPNTVVAPLSLYSTLIGLSFFHQSQLADPLSIFPASITFAMISVKGWSLRTRQRTKIPKEKTDLDQTLPEPVPGRRTPKQKRKRKTRQTRSTQPPQDMR